MIAIDLPGAGATPPLPGEMSIRTLCAATTQFLRVEGLSGIDAVGSSMGGRVVLELARRGGVLGGVVSLDPGGFWRGWERHAFYASIWLSIRLDRRAAGDRLGPPRPRLFSAPGAALLPDAASAADKPATSAAMQKTGNAPNADADMQAVLDELAQLGGKPIEALTPAEARKQSMPSDAVMSLLKKQGKDTSPSALVPGVTSVDREIPGAAGNLPVRVYTPDGAGPFPVVVYFHGGGWVIADKQVYDGGARAISKHAQAVVVSVDYRLAPEAKFPAAQDDALAAYKWVAGNAASIKGDAKRLALAGESAGGNLAIATAVAARAAKLQPPTHMLAVYPVGQTGNLDTKSYKDSASAKPLNKPMIERFVDKLLAKPADKADPRLDLVNAKLAGLPPVTIINAQIDPLREDGALLETALKRAGVKVQRKIYSGTAHEFFDMGAAVKKAVDAQKFGGEALRASFGGKAALR